MRKLEFGKPAPAFTTTEETPKRDGKPIAATSLLETKGAIDCAVEKVNKDPVPPGALTIEEGKGIYLTEKAAAAYALVENTLSTSLPKP